MKSLVAHYKIMIEKSMMKRFFNGETMTDFVFYRNEILKKSPIFILDQTIYISEDFLDLEPQYVSDYLFSKINKINHPFEITLPSRLLDEQLIRTLMRKKVAGVYFSDGFNQDFSQLQIGLDNKATIKK